MAILDHYRTTAYSIFQIGISRNTKCDYTVGFPKSGHIYMVDIVIQDSIDVCRSLITYAVTPKPHDTICFEARDIVKFPQHDIMCFKKLHCGYTKVFVPFHVDAKYKYVWMGQMR